MNGYLYISYFGDELVDCKNFDTFEEFEQEIKDCAFEYFGSKKSFMNNLKLNKVLRYVNETPESKGLIQSQSGWYIIDFTTEIDYYTLDTSHSKHITPLLKIGLRHLKLEKLGIK
jgi:hypothetical protein